MSCQADASHKDNISITETLKEKDFSLKTCKNLTSEEKLIKLKKILWCEWCDSSNYLAWTSSQFKEDTLFLANELCDETDPKVITLFISELVICLQNVTNFVTLKRILRWILSVLKNVARDDAFFFRTASFQVLLQALFEKWDFIRISLSKSKEQQQSVLDLIHLCVMNTKVYKGCFEFLVQSFQLMEQDIKNVPSTCLIWCMGFLFSLINVCNKHSLSFPLTHDLLYELFKKKAIQFECIASMKEEHFNSLYSILGKMLILGLDQKLSMDWINSFEPFLYTLQENQIEKEPFLLTSNALRLLRRTPESCLSKLTQVINMIYSDISFEIEKIISSSTVLDLFKNEIASQNNSLVHAFFSALCRKIFSFNVAQRSVNLVSDRLCRMTICIPERISLIKSLLICMDQSNVLFCYWNKILQYCSQLLSFLLTDGCVSHNENLQRHSFLLLGYYLVHIEKQEDSIKCYQFLLHILKNNKKNDCIRVAALKAFCFFLSSSATVNLSVFLSHGNVKEFIKELTILASQQGCKPLSRFLHLLSVYALLRLKRTQCKEDISLSILKKTLTTEDSLMNSISLIQKGHVDECLIHASIIRELFTFKNVQVLEKELLFFSREQDLRKENYDLLNFGFLKKKSSPFFKGILHIGNILLKERCWIKKIDHEFNSKIFSSTGYNFPFKYQQLLCEEFGLAFLDLLGFYRESNEFLSFSQSHISTLIETILLCWCDMTQNTQGEILESQFLFTLITCHPYVSYVKKMSCTPFYQSFLPLVKNQKISMLSEELFNISLQNNTKTQTCYFFPDLQGVTTVLQSIFSSKNFQSQCLTLCCHESLRQSILLINLSKLVSKHETSFPKISLETRTMSEAIGNLLQNYFQNVTLPKIEKIFSTEDISYETQYHISLCAEHMSSFLSLYQILNEIHKEEELIQEATPVEKIKTHSHSKPPITCVASTIKTNHFQRLRFENHFRVNALQPLYGIYFGLECLEFLCHTGCFNISLENVQVWVEQFLRLLDNYFTITKTLKVLNKFVTSQIPTNEFPVSMIVTSLYLVAKKKNDFIKFFQCLDEKKMQKISLSTITLLLPIFKYLLTQTLSLPNLTLLVDFFLSQIRDNMTSEIKNFILYLCHKAFTTYSSCASVWKKLLLSLVMSLKAHEVNFLIKVIEIASGNPKSIRKIVLQLLQQTNLPCHCIQSYLRVFACDSTDIQSLSLALLHERTSYVWSLESFNSIISFLSDSFIVEFSTLAAVAIIEEIKKHQDNQMTALFLAQCFRIYNEASTLSTRTACLTAITLFCQQDLLANEKEFCEILIFLLEEACLNSSLHIIPSNDSLEELYVSQFKILGYECIQHFPGCSSHELFSILQRLEYVTKKKLTSKNQQAEIFFIKYVTTLYETVGTSVKETQDIHQVLLEVCLNKIVDPQIPAQDVQYHIASILVSLFSHYSLSSDTLCVEQWINKFLKEITTNSSLVSRQGYALALAACIKGIGLCIISKYHIIDFLVKAADNSSCPITRQAALFCFESCFKLLQHLFEPWIHLILDTFLKLLADPLQYVRSFAHKSVTNIMASLSSYGLITVLPILLQRMHDSHWRVRVGAINGLSAMNQCDTLKLAPIFPKVIPVLCEASRDPNNDVKLAAHNAITTIGSTIKNPSVLNVLPTLLQAIEHPDQIHVVHEAHTLLVQEIFTSQIDSPSLSFIISLVLLGLRERNAQLKQKAAAIVTSLPYLCQQPTHLSFYFTQLTALLFDTLIDPIPGVRSMSAKALGSLTKTLDEKHITNLLTLLLGKLKSSSTPVERSGAAYALAQVITSLPPTTVKDLIPQLLYNVEHLSLQLREGYLGIFVFLPSCFDPGFHEYVSQVFPVVLRCLSSEDESFRNVAFRAAEVLVNKYTSTHSILLLTPLEHAVFDVDWKVRYSSVTLLGNVIEILLKCNTMPDEKMQQEVMSFERRSYVLSLLYMIRSDEHLVVRQQAALVWKSVVQDNAKTLKEVIPILLRRVVNYLQSPHLIKQKAAANCVTDISKKFSQEATTQLLPQLLKLSDHESKTAQHGACKGLSKLLPNLSMACLSKFRDPILQQIQSPLCDEDEDIQQTAVECLGCLIEKLNENISMQLCKDLIQTVTQPVTFNLLEAISEKRSKGLRGVSALMKTYHHLMAPLILETVTHEELDIAKIRLLQTISTLSKKDSFHSMLTQVVPILFTCYIKNTHVIKQKAKISSPDQGQQTSLNDQCQERICEEEILQAQILECFTTLLQTCLLFDDLFQHFFTILLSTDLSEAFKIDCSTVFDVKEISMTEIISIMVPLLPSQQFSIEAPILLRSFLPKFLQSSSTCLRDAYLHLLLVILEKVKLNVNSSSYILLTICQVIEKTVVSLDNQTTELPKVMSGLHNRACFDAVYGFLHLGFSSYETTVKEAAAQGLSEILPYCPTDVLKQVAVKITGPLIRATVERISSTWKVIILRALTIIIKKAGEVLRPLIPQLQISFCKALVDPSSQVRVTACNGILALSRLQVLKKETLIMELWQMINLHTDEAVLKTLYQTLIQIIETPSPYSLTVETVNKFEISFLPFLRDPDHLIACRTEAIQCFVIVLTKQMPNEILSNFIKELDFFVEKENEVLTQLLSQAFQVDTFVNVIENNKQVQVNVRNLLKHYISSANNKYQSLELYSSLLRGCKSSNVSMSSLIFDHFSHLSGIIYQLNKSAKTEIILQFMKNLKSFLQDTDLTLDQRRITTVLLLTIAFVCDIGVQNYAITFLSTLNDLGQVDIDLISKTRGAENLQLSDIHDLSVKLVKKNKAVDIKLQFFNKHC